MAEFQLVIISAFVIATLPFAAAGSPTRLSVSVGDEITLFCQNAQNFHDRCYSTTWIFGGSGSRTAVALYEYGKIHSDATARSHRLSVTANCSLVIKEVTSLDQGQYTCRQFMSGQVSDSVVVLSVFNKATTPSNSTSNVTRMVFPGKYPTTATTTTATTTTATTTTAKPKSTRPTSTPTPAETPTTTTIIKSITTTTITSLMEKTEVTTTTEIISADTITMTNITTITIKSPKETTTFNSTTTTTIKSARAAEECLNTVQSTILIIVACGFVTLFIMLAVIIWQISKRNKTQMSGNVERSTNHCLGLGTNVDRVRSEHNQGNAVISSNVRVSYTSSEASTDGSSIYATMKRI